MFCVYARKRKEGSVCQYKYCTLSIFLSHFLFPSIFEGRDGSLVSCNSLFLCIIVKQEKERIEYYNRYCMPNPISYHRMSINTSLLKIMLFCCFFLVACFRLLTSNDRSAAATPSKTIIASGTRYRNQNELIFSFGEEDRKSFIKSFGQLCTQDDDRRLHSSVNRNRLMETYTRLEKLSSNIKLNQRADELKLDLWKFCAMGIGYAFAFVDESQVLFQQDDGVHALDFFRDISGNYIIQADLGQSSIHLQSSLKVINSALIGLGQTESGRKFARSVVSVLLSRVDSLLVMDNYALWKGREMFRLLEESKRVNPTEWNIMTVTCAGLDVTGVYSDHPHGNSGLCLRNGGSPCCQITTEPRGSRKGSFILLSHSVEKKTSIQDGESEDLFFSKTKIVLDSSLNQPPSLFFEIMLENDCLPSHACHSCLSKQDGGDQKTQCAACQDPCSCYCEALCKIRPLSRNVSKKIYVEQPKRQRNAHRFIPRLIHQTYFEPITAEKYPNFSRLVNSWKASGWDYSFYTDEDAEKFLTEHFPPEVREAYDALVPGAYKADLFRYCVLFIFGGVYSDVDVMLSADLDVLLEENIGFMVPVDEVSKRIINYTHMDV